MKYILIDAHGTSLYRIKALKDFADVKKGDMGGFVESERNLSQDGDCWIYDTATVLDNAIVKDNAKIFNDVIIKDSACIYGEAKLYGNACVLHSGQIFGNAKVSDTSVIYDNAKVYGNAIITRSSHICGNAKIYGHAMITNNACIEDNAQVYGHAKVNNSVRVMDYARVHGHASLSGTTIIQDNVSISANDNFKNLRLQGVKSFATLNDYTLFTIKHLFGDFYYISHIVDNQIIFEQKYLKLKSHDFLTHLQSQIPIGDPVYDELLYKIKLNELKFASQGANYSFGNIRLVNSF